MKTYVELKVPIINSARWLAELKKELHDLLVRWQNGFYHITVAFITEVSESIDVSKILAKHLENVEALWVSFDKLDAFTTSDSGMHMIYLTASNPSCGLTSLIDSIRCDLAAHGCSIEPFILHVTLGRLMASEASLDNLSKCISIVRFSPFNLQIKTADYREFKGESLKKFQMRQ